MDMRVGTAYGRCDKCKKKVIHTSLCITCWMHKCEKCWGENDGSWSCADCRSKK